MKPIFNCALAITFLLSAGLIALAQESKPLIDFSNDPCGNPLTVSTVYILVKGTVVSVIDGETLLVELADRKRKRIKLVGVDAPDSKSALGKSAKEYLANFVLGKPVEISFIISVEDENRNQITAMMSVAGSEESDVSRELLKMGLARYKDAGAALDWYLRCHYKRVEDGARTAKRGLWASAG